MDKLFHSLVKTTVKKKKGEQTFAKCTNKTKKKKKIPQAWKTQINR